MNLKSKLFIILVIINQLSLVSCTSQALQGVNGTDCKSVKINCKNKGFYDEWWLEASTEVSCSCRIY